MGFVGRSDEVGCDKGSDSGINGEEAEVEEGDEVEEAKGLVTIEGAEDLDGPSALREGNLKR